MKIKRTSVSVLSSLCLFSVLPNALAAKKIDANGLAQKLQEISQQAEELQREMKMLKAELNQLKREKKQHTQRLAKANSRGKSKARSQAESKEAVEDTSILFPKTVHIPLMPTVTTSPYIGLRSSFDASDLLVNVPTMGEDLRLMRQRLKIVRALGGKNPFEDRSVIIISGKLEPVIFYRQAYEGRRDRSDIDLAAAELDFSIEASPWAMGFMSLAYDNSHLDTVLTNSPVGRRLANSNIYLKRGFVTLGKLDQFPLYLSAGQMYVNFGRYGSALVSPPLTMILGQTNARQIQLGYAKEDGFDVSAYAFRGDTYLNNPNKVNEGGVNVRYMKELAPDRSISIGAGYISNIADSAGMQATGLPYPRQGFAFLTRRRAAENIPSLFNERLVRRAPALNFHGEFGLGLWTLMGEYVGTVRSFDLKNVAYNWRGASLRAMHLELNRKFEVFGKPANASIAYGHSWKALAIGLPLDKYSFVFNVSPIKDTIVSFEFSRSKNYRSGTSTYIKGVDVPLILPFAPYFSPGGYSNMVLLQLGLYF